MPNAMANVSACSTWGPGTLDQITWLRGCSLKPMRAAPPPPRKGFGGGGKPEKQVKVSPA